MPPIFTLKDVASLLFELLGGKCYDIQEDRFYFKFTRFAITILAYIKVKIGHCRRRLPPGYPLVTPWLPPSYP